MLYYVILKFGAFLSEFRKTWTYHRKTKHQKNDVDEKNQNGNDDYVDHIDDEDESNNEVNDRGKRPVKPAKRFLSKPQPICTVYPNVKTSVSEDQKGK